MLCLFFATVLSFFFSCELRAQTDTEFWFAAPEVTSGHGDSPIYLRLAAYDTEAFVRITVPAQNAVLFESTIPAGEAEYVNLTANKDIVECKPADQVLNYGGLKIESTAPITAYYDEVSRSNPEIFSLKGGNALGMHFVIPMQNALVTCPEYNPLPRASFDIVATTDNTTVKITPSADLIGRPAGVTYEVILDEGQTYSAVSLGYDPEDHAVGSVVESDKPIAITYKDDSVELYGPGLPHTCKDLLGDQIVPTSILGTKYVAVKGFMFDDDRVFIVATRDDTEVVFNGEQSNKILLDFGEVYMYSLSENICLIESSHPVNVLHLTGFGCELGAAHLPSIRCKGSSEVAFTRAKDSEFALVIIVENGSEGDFILNGSGALIDPTQFQPVPGTGGEILAGRFILNSIPINQASFVENTSALFHLGIINGEEDSDCNYGFFSDFTGLNLGSDETVCSGQDVVLDAGAGKHEYLWSTGENSQMIKVSESGEYWVEARRFTCVLRDTIKVAVKDAGYLNAGSDTAICPDQTLLLVAEGEFERYVWQNGTEGREYLAEGPGVYVVEAIDESGCEAVDTVYVDEKIIEVDLGADLVICPEETVELKPSGYYAGYLWSDGSTGSAISVSDSGVYSLTVFDEFGCQGRDDVRVDVSPLIDAEIIASETELCKGDTLRLSLNPTRPDYRYEWSTGETSSSVIATKSGGYWARIYSDAGCEGFTDTVDVDFDPSDLDIVEISLSGETIFDSTRLNQNTCRYFRIRNNDASPFVLTEAKLSRNVEFSVPQSQLPLTIPGGGERDLVVCFSPSAVRDHRDTLSIESRCFDIELALKCVGAPGIYSSENRCGADVSIVTDSLVRGGLFNLSPARPNPAQNTVSALFAIEASENDIKNIKASVFGIYGNTSPVVSIKEIRRRTIFDDDYLIFEAVADLSELPAGFYVLRVVSPVGISHVEFVKD